MTHIRILVVAVLTAACGGIAVGNAADESATLEGVGDDMGYRMFGEQRKGRPILLQNSRPYAVEVFDEGRGVFVPVPPYSDREFTCRGVSRKLNLRYRDKFRESAPFQVIVGCGREIQFIAPAQVAPPRPVELMTEGTGSAAAPEETPAAEVPAAPPMTAPE